MDLPAHRRTGVGTVHLLHPADEAGLVTADGGAVRADHRVDSEGRQEKGIREGSPCTGEPLSMPVSILPHAGQAVHKIRQLAGHHGSLAPADVPRRAAAVVRVKEVVDAPVFRGGDHLADGPVPGGIVAEDGGRADDVGTGVLLPQQGQEAAVLRPPVTGGIAVIVLRHDVDGVMVVLADGDHHHLGRPAGEIPGRGGPERRVVIHLVPAGMHADGPRIETSSILTQRLSIF